jgi:hypothetical protein
MAKKGLTKKMRYFFVIAVLDLPPWAYIILGNHGLSDFSKACFGGIYFLFPLFVLRKCPFHVLAKWMFSGSEKGNVLAYMRRAYGRNRFVLLIGFIASFITAFIVMMVVS